MYVPTGFFMISQVLSEQVQEFRLSNRTIQNLGGVARLTINEYGRMFIEQASGVPEVYEQWAAYKEDDLGLGFEARMTQNSGALTSGIIGTWTKIEGELSWIVDFNEGDSEFEGLLEIRPVVNDVPGSNVASAVFTLIVGEAPPVVSPDLFFWDDSALVFRTFSYEDNVVAEISETEVSGDQLRVAALTPTRIVVSRGLGENELATYNFVGDTWEFDSATSVTLGTFATIFALSSTRVVVQTGSLLRIYDEVDGEWEEFGSATNIGDYDLEAVLSSTKVVLVDRENLGVNETVNVAIFEYNGTAWTKLGTDYALGTNGIYDITGLSETTCAISYTPWADDGDLLGYFTHNGTIFSVTGNELATKQCRSFAISATNIMTVQSNEGIYEFQERHFDGDDWTTVGSATPIESVQAVFYNSLCNFNYSPAFSI
jgi:hypothetical protein